jgi:site-specific DNA-methyltransferase (adenine-specific)
MGKKWDYDVPSVDIWKECLRVLKPGGYLLSFAGTRTQHRMAVNIEDAGFEIRDMIAWVYGSGFPKSLNIGKAVDKLQGNEREVSGYEERFGREGRKAKCGFKEEYVGASGTQDQSAMKPIMLPVSEEAKQWEGWGTALKPALEPITVARKPLGEKTVAENVLKWGTGGINIDGCRVGTDTRTYKGMSSNKPEVGTFRDDNWKPKNIEVTATGRFPANLIHDGSDEVVGLFPNSKSAGEYKKDKLNTFIPEEAMFPLGYQTNAYAGESGSASRFFYCAKASKRERNIGCEGLEEKPKVFNGQSDKPSEDMKDVEKRFTTLPVANFHPTVKPLALMEYLVKLVSREGQVVLDPFMGSGTTGMACKKLDREFIGIEMMPEYMEIAKARIEGVKKEDQLNMI